MDNNELKALENKYLAEAKKLIHANDNLMVESVDEKLAAYNSVSQKDATHSKENNKESVDKKSKIQEVEKYVDTVVNIDSSSDSTTGIKETDNSLTEASDNQTNYVLKYNILPLPLVVADNDNIAVIMIKRGASLPAKVVKRFYTKAKALQAARISLFLGEHLFCDKNEHIANIKLPYLKRCKNGEIIITVTIEVNTDGEIILEAIDEGSLNKRKVVVGNEWMPEEYKVDILLAEARSSHDEESRRKTKFVLLRDVSYSILEAKYYSKREKHNIDTEKKNAIKTEIRKLKKLTFGLKPDKMTEECQKEILTSLNTLKTYIK